MSLFVLKIQQFGMLVGRAHQRPQAALESGSLALGGEGLLQVGDGDSGHGGYFTDLNKA